MLGMTLSFIEGSFLGSAVGTVFGTRRFRWSSDVLVVRHGCRQPVIERHRLRRSRFFLEPFISVAVALFHSCAFFDGRAFFEWRRRRRVRRRIDGRADTWTPAAASTTTAAPRRLSGLTF